MKDPNAPSLRDDIVRVSIALGTQLGEDGLAMRAIAGQMGGSVTGLYQYFDGKASILREIRSHGIRMLQQALSARSGAERPAQRLRDMAHAYVEFARDHAWLYTTVFVGKELDWTTMTPEESGERLALLQSSGALFREGIARGDFHQDLDPVEAVQGTWAALHGLASLIVNGRISTSHPEFPVDSLDRIIELFVATLVLGYTRAASVDPPR